MKPKRNDNGNDGPEELNQKELAAIKRLMILLLLKLGAKQEEVAVALQLDRSTISRWFKGLELKKLDLLKK